MPKARGQSGRPAGSGAAQDPAARSGPGWACAQAYGHEARIFDISFNPLDESIIASASEDEMVRVWRREGGADTYTAANCCKGHEAEVLRVNFSPDATLLASGMLRTSMHPVSLPQTRLLDT